ncbi:ankyrin repeat protein [Pelomyxa schiedti]|nr:ankyrin repeat protein [Pelomyxa schiedti]
MATAEDCETLLIEIVEAKGLVPADPTGVSDPYVVVTVGGKKKKTKTARHTLSPRFEDARFKFLIARETTEIVCEIFDHAMILKDDHLGIVHIPVSSLQPYNTLHDKWYALEALAEGDKASGELHLRLYLFPRKTKDAHVPKKGAKPKNPLFRAVKHRDLLTIMNCLENPKIDPNAQDKRGDTPLHRACAAWENEHIILTLLSHPAVRADITNVDSNTALHAFCQFFRNPNFEEAFNLLIAKRADVNARNKQHETPLHKAVFNNSIRIMLVEHLIANGAQVNAAALRGGTALHYSMYFCRTDLVSILIQGDASLLTALDDKGRTAMDLCRTLSFAPVLQKLTEYQDLAQYVDTLPIPEYADQLTNVKNILIKSNLFKWKLRELTEPALQKLDIQPAGLRLRLVQEFKKLTDVDPSTAAVEAAEPTRPADASDFRNSLTSGTKQWLITEGEVEFTELLGQGAAGKVYRGLYKNHVVAIKVLKAGATKEIEEFKQEFDIISSISSPHIVKLFGAIMADKAVGDKLCMVMEFCARGSLYDVLSKGVAEIAWPQVFHFASQLLMGMRALHSHDPQILHRDLKSLNLLVTKEWHVKVCDFGLSRFDTGSNMKTLQRLRGTYAYAAPEVYFGARYTAKSDVFSIGILLWELVYRCINQKYQRPYAEFPELKMDYQIIIKTAKQGLRPTIPPSTPPPLAAMIRQCIVKDQDLRPSCEGLFQGIEEFKEDYRVNKEQWDSTIVNPRIGEPSF